MSKPSRRKERYCDTVVSRPVWRIASASGLLPSSYWAMSLLQCVCDAATWCVGDEASHEFAQRVHQVNVCTMVDAIVSVARAGFAGGAGAAAISSTAVGQMSGQKVLPKRDQELRAAAWKFFGIRICQLRARLNWC
jgi:hypothetical protein